MMNIPYLSLQKVTEMHLEEICQATDRVVRGGWYLLGEEVKAFEEEYARFTGAEHCISCANGLDALTLTLRAYKELGLLHEGDEVLVPSNTFIATILSITENRLKAVAMPPVAPLNVETIDMESLITPRTKAVIIVHLYGFNAWNEKVSQMCRKHGLLLIEDCAQKHDQMKHEGTACWSFYPGKNLGALGDAGAVTTDNALLANTIRALANYGTTRKYVSDYLGRNSRMDELQAAVLRVKLRYLNADNARRQTIARQYIDNVKNPLITLPQWADDAVWHIFPIFTEKRDNLQQYLTEKGIGTNIHYPIPPHRQKCYAQGGLNIDEQTARLTERISEQELSIPCNQTMTPEEVQYVIDNLNAWNGE